MSEQDETKSMDRMTGKFSDSPLVSALKRANRHVSPEFLNALEESIQAAAVSMQIPKPSQGGSTKDALSLRLRASHETYHTGDQWVFEIEGGSMDTRRNLYIQLNEYLLNQPRMDPRKRVDVNIQEDVLSIRTALTIDALRVINEALLKPHGIAPIDEALAQDKVVEKPSASAVR